jgi:hypothetical protein
LEYFRVGLKSAVNGTDYPRRSDRSPLIIPR